MCEEALGLITSAKPTVVYNDRRTKGRRYKFSGIKLSKGQLSELNSLLHSNNSGYQFIVTDTRENDRHNVRSSDLLSRQMNAGISILVIEMPANEVAWITSCKDRM